MLLLSVLALPASGNEPPVLELGPERLLVPPDDDIVLLALPDDPEGRIVSVQWTQVSGTPATLTHPQTALLHAGGLLGPGSRVFSCTVTDHGGLAATDEVTVTVVDLGPPGELLGTPRTWHEVTVSFQGPSLSETGSPNPFLDRRLDVRFTHADSGESLLVPGFFAADGEAAETGASAGNKWHVRFVPPRAGTWVYEASFRAGPGVAVADDPLAGVPTSFDGASGAFGVLPAGPGAQGFHKEGRLAYTGGHHLVHQGSGRAFLKGGANSPENLLAFADFDGTPSSHRYLPHVADWKDGDPAWKGGLGKGLIGALNYLAGKGMNAVYFLTYNVGGDGDDVFPFVAKGERLRYDVSKLEQWELVFDHADRLGLLLHVVTQEQENDNGGHGLDTGNLGPERKLYYRELVARFGHHLGVLWNLGEENTNTHGQRSAFYEWITALDPWRNPVAVHTFPDKQHDVYLPLLADGLLEAATLQDGVAALSHDAVVQWRGASAAAGRPWVVTSDEFGPSSHGVVPDANDFWHDEVRTQVLWGNLLGGGAGCEWYFGYQFPHDDLDCEDWRSRDHMWRLTAIALDAFRQYVPFTTMQPADALVSPAGTWCLAREGDVYAVYLPQGGSASLDLGTSSAGFTVRWIDPRLGGAPQTGSKPTIAGPGWRGLGNPPGSTAQDWLALVERQNKTPTVTSVSALGQPFTGGQPLAFQVLAEDPDGDLAAALVHLFSPTGNYIAALPCEAVAAGVFHAALPVLPAVQPGVYPLVGQAFDQMGGSHFLVGTFVAW